MVYGIWPLAKGVGLGGLGSGMGVLTLLLTFWGTSCGALALHPQILSYTLSPCLGLGVQGSRRTTPFSSSKASYSIRNRNQPHAPNPIRTSGFKAIWGEFRNSVPFLRDSDQGPWQLHGMRMKAVPELL